MRQTWSLAVACLTKLTILTKHGLKNAKAKNINQLQALSYKRKRCIYLSIRMLIFLMVFVPSVRKNYIRILPLKKILTIHTEKYHIK